MIENHFLSPFEGSNHRSSVADYHQQGGLIAWSEFIQRLCRLHAALELPQPSAETCCRLLYRFDVSGQGSVNVQAFAVHACDLLQHIAAQSTSSETKTAVTTAVLNSFGRPNVEAFTTPKAVRKLFTARAQAATQFCEISPPDDECAEVHDRRQTIEREMELLAMGNSRLAKIRHLPVTRLLRYDFASDCEMVCSNSNTDHSGY